MSGLGQTTFIVVCIVIFARFIILSNKSNPEKGIVSALSCVMYILCLFISAQMQAANLTTTKLLTAHILGPVRPHEIDSLSFYWAIELIIIFISEILFVNIYRNFCKKTQNPPNYPYKRIITQQKYCFLFLISIGFLANIIFQSDVTERTNEGQGVFTALKTFLVVGLCVCSFNNFFYSKNYFIIFSIGMALLIASAVRSPVFSVAVAYVAGMIARKKLHTNTLSKILVFGIFLALTASIMSDYRSGLINGRTRDLSASFINAAENPFVAIYGGGVDTLDGYRFSKIIQPYEASRPGNLIVAVTTFVPRAIWNNKPKDLSIDVTKKYLGWGDGGIFLSLVGYLRIALGGYFKAILFIGVFFGSISFLIQKNYKSFYGFILIIISFRTLLAGSPFDVYYGILLAIIYFLGSIVGKILWLTFHPRKPQINLRGFSQL